MVEELTTAIQSLEDAATNVKASVSVKSQLEDLRDYITGRIAIQLQSLQDSVTGMVLVDIANLFGVVGPQLDAATVTQGKSMCVSSMMDILIDNLKAGGDVTHTNSYKQLQAVRDFSNLMGHDVCIDLKDMKLSPTGMTFKVGDNKCPFLRQVPNRWRFL